jgi:hypothetical protein
VLPPEASTSIDSSAPDEFSAASFNSNNAEDVPAVSGVPDTTPVVEFSESPSGRLPALIAQRYGRTPPEPCSVAEYAVPTVAFGKAVVVIVGDDI